jgi:hypothetical protein
LRGCSCGPDSSLQQRGGCCGRDSSLQQRRGRARFTEGGGGSARRQSSLGMVGIWTYATSAGLGRAPMRDCRGARVHLRHRAPAMALTPRPWRSRPPPPPRPLPCSRPRSSAPGARSPMPPRPSPRRALLAVAAAAAKKLWIHRVHQPTLARRIVSLCIDEEGGWSSKLTVTPPPRLCRLPGDFGFDPLGLGKDPAFLKWYREAELIHGRWAMAVVLGIFMGQPRCAIWGLWTRGNGERRRRRWLRGCGRVDLPLMRMRDLGAQGADLPSTRPRRRRRWQAGQRVEKKARRGERQKARGRGFGRTVHHLHLCTSTLHTYADNVLNNVVVADPRSGLRTLPTAVGT